MIRTCSTNGKKRNTCKIVVRKPEGIPRHWWVDNTQMDSREIGCGGMDWADLTQDRDRWMAFVETKMNLRAP
jgi:hypothetical protein